MTDAEDCANDLRGFAAEPDVPEVRDLIDRWIDDFLKRGGQRAELLAAFDAQHIPTTLAAFIRQRLNTSARTRGAPQGQANIFADTISRMVEDRRRWLAERTEKAGSPTLNSRLIYSSEKWGCGATIQLGNDDICMISIARTGILVRTYRPGPINRLFGSIWGATLFNEKNVYKVAKAAMVLSEQIPEVIPALNFKNPILSTFAHVVWSCSSAGEVAVRLNEALGHERLD